MGRKLARTLQLGILFSVVLFGYTLFSDQEFAKWQTNFRHYAQQHGVKNATLDMAFRGLLTDKKVLKLDTYQPEFSRPVWEYLDTAVSAERVEQGRYVLKQYAPLLKKISETYQVDIEYIVAIWGMESSYGQQLGNYSAIRSLATLAYQGREDRRDFWRTQLIAALRILQSGDMPGNNLRGSWAGALGHTQFIPSTFEEFAVDFDGDGRRDLVSSTSDALASTANFLKKRGWQTGMPWGFEVRIPDDMSIGGESRRNKKSLSSWMSRGVVRADGSALIQGNLSSSSAAGLMAPAGANGPVFLVFKNFDAIYSYNAAESYALAIAHLSDRLQGNGGFSKAWPTDDAGTSRAERREIQQFLLNKGYDIGTVDGLIGDKSRQAIRQEQIRLGLSPTGRAGQQILAAFRNENAQKMMQ